ncbi:hypothetical protein KY348_06830 [Candidatus Woesearchaeota archaeon]|nr:hypothetical protein [Candidatus Woesearchaeota archaeon]
MVEKKKNRRKKDKKKSKRKKEKENKEREKAAILKKKIKYLEEELVRKMHIIENLKKENLILFKTALKRAEKKVKERS